MSCPSHSAEEPGWLSQHACKHRKHCSRGTGLGQPSCCHHGTGDTCHELLLHKSFSLPSKDCRYGYISSCLAWTRPKVMSLLNRGTFSLSKEGLLFFFSPECARAHVSTQRTWQKSRAPLPASHLQDWEHLQDSNLRPDLLNPGPPSRWEASFSLWPPGIPSWVTILKQGSWDRHFLGVNVAKDHQFSHGSISYCS